ncbi:MAG: hypothetical protein RBT36_08150 [Desulfobulbus sp.]|jgi:hypothetical protein|nr:hypothetical protein [Desulfobulbus sp.]
MTVKSTSGHRARSLGRVVFFSNGRVGDWGNPTWRTFQPAFFSGNQLRPFPDQGLPIKISGHSKQRAKKFTIRFRLHDDAKLAKLQISGSFL